ncbi:IucA/IucC family protein [Paenibacillus sedimenti]|uniref:Siderophore synthetase component n=1 Tax=Paenibacillus sedimenti TaxID=2770274 RepID=A0A926KUS5_9BACL|nr:IucA/IucC family protein [Paenibacillus sedimenti]MBD0383536.1 hypothetical protein [Paenibacillus sedimenti]
MRDRSIYALQAEQAAMTRLLNAYIREAAGSKLPVEDGMLLKLSQTHRTLKLSFRYVSASGHHRYVFPIMGEERESAGQQALSFQEVTEWLLAEVAAADAESLEAGERKLSLQKQIANSVAKTIRYLQAKDDIAPQPTSGADCPYLRSEQSLLFGHPFHPTPKSSEGLTEQDLVRFAPELHASYRLDYWLVHPELFDEEWIGESPMQSYWSEREREWLKRAGVGPRYAGYRLLPSHPWQSAHLKSLPAVQHRERSGQLLWLGSLGDTVYPTASVRTVWSPEHGLFLKLPLHVRITNFIRTNTAEQRRRSLDAARIWEDIGRRFHWAGFGVLQEPGSLSVSDSQLAEAFTVLLREGDPGLVSQDEEWHAAASMFEDEGNEPWWLPGTELQALEWTQRYVSIYLLPVLKLFAEEGFGLEAHVQNTLIRLQDRSPVRCLVRDLEGVSVCRETAREKGWIGTAVPETSPVLYDREEAWMRLLYYNVTNHLSHMLAAVSRSSGAAESLLWRSAGEAAADQARIGSVRLWEWTERLLMAPTLPAKANLISRFRQRAEQPEYVQIPNPLYQPSAVYSFGTLR